MIQIDLQTRMIPDAQRVWRLFPGSGYRFLDSFLNESVGYLDLPNLALPEDEPLAQADLIPLIALSTALRKSLRPKVDEAEKMVLRAPDDPAVEDENAEIEQALVETPRNRRERARLRNAAVAFYSEAKAGDLVIMPEPVVKRAVFVGVIIDDKITYSRYHNSRERITVPARNIRWLESVKENSLSSELSETLRQTHPFTLVERSRFIEVMSIAYSSFVFQGAHVATVYNGDDFLDADSAYLGVLSKLAAAACWSIDNAKEGLGHELIDVVIGSQSPEYTCSQVSAIHSPGFTRLISGTMVSIAVAALVVAFAELSQLNPAEIERGINATDVVNTLAVDDPYCAPKVSDISKRVLLTIGVANTIKMCDSARIAAERARLRSSAHSQKKQ
jgi:hypothetical protein